MMEICRRNSAAMRNRPKGFVTVLVLLCTLLLAGGSGAMEVFPADWEGVVINAKGPDSAGSITVQAGVGEERRFELTVNSMYGSFEFSEEIESPQLLSLIHI